MKYNNKLQASFQFIDCEKSEKQIDVELIKLVRELIGPIAAFQLTASVNALPRTRSGKIARKSIADLAKNGFVKVLSLSTIKI